MMHIETERKFLVTGEYKSLAHDATRIAQGYIASGNGRTVRVRIRGDRGYLTIKGTCGPQGLSRHEWEREIPLPEAQELMTLCEPGIIEKTRHLVRAADGHVWEVDEFYGDNQGLTLAEVELQSEDEPYEKPAFVGREVTGDRRYYNAHMRHYPYRMWAAKT